MPKGLAMLTGDFFSKALQGNSAAVAGDIEALLLEQTNGKSVVPCQNLDITQFSRLKLCEIVFEDTPRPAFYRYWGGEDYDQLYSHRQLFVAQVKWNDTSLHVVHLEWATACGGEHRDFVVANSVEEAESFILEVERKTHAPGEAILVFKNGYWSRSQSLYAATQAASFDDLILADEMKDSIRSDFKRFLESEERYQRLGIAWRRGALIIGPPGNGKTHCVRALVKELNVSSLYVQSLSHPHHTAEQMWQRVFDRARGLRPCVLVLEDLDSLVNNENRSFFLNQLDGFEQNHGLIVLATTNYPERIDSAIINRPSRFDRKYHFNLPTLHERREYLETWQQRVASETGWKQDQISATAESTDGFSFAYLKELVISTVMKWMSDSSVAFEDVLRQQATILQQQMKTEVSETNQ